MITSETRRESYELIKPICQTRQKMVLDRLSRGGASTANELALDLYSLGMTPHFNRNFVQPRLNELVHKGKVEVVGKRYDRITGRTCAIYKVKE
jgi:hypothetical protein